MASNSSNGIKLSFWQSLFIHYSDQPTGGYFEVPIQVRDWGMGTGPRTIGKYEEEEYVRLEHLGSKGNCKACDHLARQHRISRAVLRGEFTNFPSVKGFVVFLALAGTIGSLIYLFTK